VIDDDGLRLLSTYVDGPRIWDAADLFARVVRLEEQGFVEPVGGFGAYRLTDAGRKALAQGS
jgi:hypothetical protein